VALIVIALPMMFGSRPMRLCGVLVMLGSSRMGFLWHIRSFAVKTARIVRA
jgi:hypothetical protein